MPGYQVFIGHLANTVTREDLDLLFRYYGKILDIQIRPNYAFVEFQDKEDAQDAVYDFNGLLFFDHRLDIRYRGSMRTEIRTKETRRVIVKNLSTSTTWQELKAFIQSTGYSATFAAIFMDRYGEGVVEFRDHNDAQDVVARLNNTEFNGRPVRLKLGKMRIRPDMTMERKVRRSDSFGDSKSDNAATESPRKRKKEDTSDKE
ncbi:uncharacterized protein EV154DRAFT_495103 [Mucor mucedo]|uniref:uncharacterized protein n=1 Tax=Mucor mucedo TaxID=29922 RepID=UPI00221E6ECC|nr:uncharacterized protein EV154DRAFT_495103 [Mucor mucedo]KAI7895494.1 hypothetical protein EV154DRAFT_495103 [Mucor mucedo]